MNAIKYLTLLCILTLAACGTKNPKSLARKYCACFKESQDNPEKLKDCQQIANENQEILGKDAEASKIYAEEIIRCAVYEFPQE